uniref:uncharacterized protein LOC127071178 n=1 Tax=Vespula vulgaris TaxID=7454 RepID=UPI00223BF4BC|nr:uncharacterized protein LOC127071178 [Vespula vulgaris]
MEEWGYSPTSDDNISDSYWFSLASNFDEYASQFSQYTFSTSNREELIFKLRSGDTRMRETTTKTGLRPTLTVTSSVVFWTSTRELRKFRGGYSYSNCEVGILGCERQQQRRAFDRPLQLLVQLCFGLRRGNIENFAEAIPNEMEEWGYSPTSDDNISDSYWFSLASNFDEYASQFSQYTFSTNLNCEVGILGCERQQQRRAFVRPLQLLVQLCFGLRRGNIENFAEAIPNEMEEWGYSPTSDDNISDSYWFSLASNFDEYASQFSQYTFSTSDREELIFKLRSGDTRMRETTTKTGLRPTLTVTSSVVFWTSTRELRKFRGSYSCKY